jgi:glycosyltransferase involved in cell wall biosynthesis
MYVGIDIEQFLRDPYGSGIQRVLQQLAMNWPSDQVQADFVVPDQGEFALLSPEQAGELLSIPFLPRDKDGDLRAEVEEKLAATEAPRVKLGELLSIYDSWLLPEVSYLPSVLERFEIFAKAMPTAMIGYDTLPMTEPGNYRFKPGTAANVSEYFRLLATADSVVCISEYARTSILERLRRDRRLSTTVAHPGGDHVIVPETPAVKPTKTRFIRLGTLEARKRPREILAAFTEAVAAGVDAELVFVGARSASDESINAELEAATRAGIGVTWIQDADDERVTELIAGASVFLSIGTEGYGIPVLEALALGTPVLYDGIQPAAELMDGNGAKHVPALTHGDLVQLFMSHMKSQELGGLSGQIDQLTIPTWAEFSRSVAKAMGMTISQ